MTLLKAKQLFYDSCELLLEWSIINMYIRVMQTYAFVKTRKKNTKLFNMYVFWFVFGKLNFMKKKIHPYYHVLALILKSVRFSGRFQFGRHERNIDGHSGHWLPMLNARTNHYSDTLSILIPILFLLKFFAMHRIITA